MAVPYLERGALPDAKIIHLVRHPLDCVRSLVGIRFFEDQENKYAQFMRRHFDCQGDPIDDAIRWWVEWNQRCERLAYKRFKLESLEKEAPLLVEALGLPERKMLDPRRVSKAVNSRQRSQLELENLAHKPSFEDFSRLAAHYGYQL